MVLCGWDWLVVGVEFLEFSYGGCSIGLVGCGFRCGSFGVGVFGLGCGLW